MKSISEDDIRYKEAEKRVKRIKNFYIFTFVYIVVNIFIFVSNYRELKPGETIWHLKYFTLPIFWGIGLLGYAISILYPEPFLAVTGKRKK